MEIGARGPPGIRRASVAVDPDGPPNGLATSEGSTSPPCPSRTRAPRARAPLACASGSSCTPCSPRCRSRPAHRTFATSRKSTRACSAPPTPNAPPPPRWSIACCGTRCSRTRERRWPLDARAAERRRCRLSSPPPREARRPHLPGRCGRPDQAYRRSRSHLPHRAQAMRPAGWTARLTWPTKGPRAGSLSISRQISSYQAPRPCIVSRLRCTLTGIARATGRPARGVLLKI